MRELLLKNTKLPKFPNVPNRKPPIDTLIEFLNKSNKSKERKISIELCSNRSLNVDTLFSIHPIFYSVTWHTQPFINYNNDLSEWPAIQLTSALVDRTKHVVLHLPCRYLSKQNIHNILTTAKQKGIKNILALWGERIRTDDCPAESTDFSYAVHLVNYIRENFANSFCVGVTGYPASHPDSSSAHKDLMHLKEKVAAGADFIITQMFFETDIFNKFYKSCRDIGIEVPIIPGINIIDSYDSLLAMARICRVNIPNNILSKIESIKNDDNAVKNYGIQHASDLIYNLLKNNVYPVPSVHIFSLNNIENVQKIFEKLDEATKSDST